MNVWLFGNMKNKIIIITKNHKKNQTVTSFLTYSSTHSPNNLVSFFHILLHLSLKKSESGLTGFEKEV
jgi:hypothetical protein